MACVWRGRRPLAPGDLPQMRALHGALFPLDYEDSFYQTAVRGLDNIFTWAAFRRCACAQGREPEDWFAVSQGPYPAPESGSRSGLLEASSPRRGPNVLSRWPNSGWQRVCNSSLHGVRRRVLIHKVLMTGCAGLGRAGMPMRAVARAWWASSPRA